MGRQAFASCKRGVAEFVGVGGWLLAASAAAGVELSWALHPRECAEQVSAALRVPCGTLGVVAFEVTEDFGCPPFVAGSETPLAYPHPAVGLVMPTLKPKNAPAGPSADSARPATSLQPMPQPAPPWVAVVDWDDAHGEAVTGLIELLASGAAQATLFALDGPELAPLGSPVGDPHVLARLCAVAEEAEMVRHRAPLAVNMSFGRLPQPGDDDGAGNCDADRLSCQIATLLAHLEGLGAAPVAAAGNHQELLFPAVLAEVLAASPLDVSWFLASQVPGALWQAPAEVEVLLPGHALCVGGAVVPAGSSFASAFWSGWYAFVAAPGPPLDAFTGTWAPAFSPAHGCFVLAQGGQLFGPCNPGLGPAVAGIVQGSASGCWQEPEASGKPVVVVPGPGDPVAQPAVPSFDHWAARNPHPAPESDPCIPCVGAGGGGVSMTASSATSPRPITPSPTDSFEDIVLNLSATSALATPVHLQRVYFRVDDAFYELALSPAGLDDMERGDLGGLVLTDFGSLLPSTTQPSLFYVFTTDPESGCETDPEPSPCFWTSTPVLLP